MEIQQIKTRLTLPEILSHYNLKPDKNHRLCCPFHEDKTPSLQLYPKTNTVYCFSSNCKTHGKSLDVIDFIMNMEKTNKHEAILKAKELITGTTPTAKSEIKSPQSDILTRMFSYFKNAIHNSPPAKEYIKSRSLDYTQLEIGYNTGQFHHGDRKNETVIKECVQTGLLYQAGTNSRAGGPAYGAFGKYGIVFPLKNKSGQIVSFYFRSTVNEDKQKHYYLKDRKGLYPGYPDNNTKKIILTEAIIDAATLLQIEPIRKQYSILTAYGTNGLTEEHREEIKGLKGLNEIIFAFDNDQAGNTAMKKYADEFKILLPQVTISTLNLPDNSDINETAQGHSPEIFTELLEKRTLLFSIEKENPMAEIPPIENSKPETLSLEPDIATNSGLRTTNSKLDTRNSEQIHYNTDELLITLFGGISLQNLDRLRVTIYLRRKPHINAQQVIRQNIDLYQDDLVEKFIRRAAEKLDHSTTLISSVIAEMTEELEAFRIAQVEGKKVNKPVKKELNQMEKDTALKNLRRENLMDWTEEKLLNTGIIGEGENAMIMHGAMTSRLLEDPVSVICLSKSGLGKSYLLERVAKCFPTEDKIENTQFTDNSFYYWQDGIKNKIILIEDMEGAQNIEYPMRELISKKYITKTSVHKDSKGNMQTVQYRVEGPATFLGCTTKEKIYEDNANRCILIYLDGSKEQDKKVMAYHKKSRAGIIDKEQEEMNRELLQNMQRMLQPRKILNPYATLIELPEEVPNPRRTLGILLSFIEVVTVYHQYQCETQQGVLITHPTHIEWAFKLLKESLFRKSDELSGALRSFLEAVKSLMKKENKKSFYMQQVRQALKLHPRTAQRYLYELGQYGYIKIAGGNKYRKGYEYEFTPLAENNNLKSSIDKHIETIMLKIWQQYQKSKAA